MVKPTEVTQDALLGAILRLVEKKSFFDITVSELTNVAGVSRMTFYRSYRNLVEVLGLEAQNTMAQFNEQLTFTGDNTYEYILKMIHFFDAHRDFVSLLVQAKQQEILRTSIVEVIADLSTGKLSVANFSKSEMEFYAEYHAAGLMSVIVDWIINKRAETPEELAIFLSKNVEGMTR